MTQDELMNVQQVLAIAKLAGIKAEDLAKEMTENQQEVMEYGLKYAEAGLKLSSKKIKELEKNMEEELGKYKVQINVSKK